MKLRIKGNSLRLRVSRSELAQFVQSGRIEETIHFSAEKDARLTYALEHAPSAHQISLRCRPQEVVVVLSTEAARRWAEDDQVGVAGNLENGSGELALLIEKDFACLDGSSADNEDTFPNPNHGAAC